MLPHKPYLLPAVDLSHDDGDPRWHAAGEDATAVVRDGVIIHYRWNGLAPGHYSEYWRLCVVEHWAELVERFEQSPEDVYTAYWYIDNHPVFWQFQEPRDGFPEDHVSFLEHEGAMSRGWPEITPHKDEEGLFWSYEFGPRLLHPDQNGFRGSFHDWKLDGTSLTYELALLAVAGKIHKHYGNDRQVVDSPGYHTN
jgi:hypothetical protein